MSIKIALAGNPNSGKTTLFNSLTGSNQFVGNWPGVTVEKKEGILKTDKDVIVTDLPGIYSLSPYTLEEVVARNYLINEHPDVILNIVDGTNLERNLYLTTQLMELGVPVVIAINMMDVVRKRGDKINIAELSCQLGCRVVEISALKNEGIFEAAEAAIKESKIPSKIPQHSFSGAVEHALAHIEEVTVHSLSELQQRWYAVKLFERDKITKEDLNLSQETLEHIENDIKACEKELDDDSESIIANERYNYITSVCQLCLTKKSDGKQTTSHKIDKFVTSRLFGLPFFALVMFLIYYISMVTIGSAATDWANDGLFGDGWHLLGIGSAEYESEAEDYTSACIALDGYGVLVTDDEGEIDTEATLFAANSYTPTEQKISYTITDEETLEQTKINIYSTAIPYDADENVTNSMTYLDALSYAEKNGLDEPDPSSYGIWVPGVPILVENGLNAIGVPTDGWVHGLVIDGIIAGVGAVLGFVPQMLVLFFLLAFVEACGYMARIAFVLDRIFRKFGLSGKSFIPILIGTGCGVPGIMASRTIENEHDRRMTVITTTFIPCGAKTPLIAMIAGAVFGGSALVATGAYFIGISAIIVSGIILKKTKAFSGETTPFVMELPDYHMPMLKNVLRSMWDNGWAFIKKAGTIVLLSTIIIWFTSYFGWIDGKFIMLTQEQMNYSVLAYIGKGIAWLFAPLGFGKWQAAVATLTGLIAKENIVGTMGILYGNWKAIGAALPTYTGLAFLVFNLLCAPCFAAMGAIKREMNSPRWTAFAIGYQCFFAYLVALCINSFGNLFAGNINGVFEIVCLTASIFVVIFGLYMLFRPNKNAVKSPKSK